MKTVEARGTGNKGHDHKKTIEKSLPESKAERKRKKQNRRKGKRRREEHGDCKRLRRETPKWR